MTDSEFSPEQWLVVRILGNADVVDPEDAVRANPLAAAWFGSLLLPGVVRRAATGLAGDEAKATAMLAESRNEES